MPNKDPKTISTKKNFIYL